MPTKLDFTEKKTVKVDMKDYITVMENDFPEEEFKKVNVKSPVTVSFRYCNSEKLLVIERR